MPKARIYKVAIPSPLRRLFDYLAPDQQASDIQPGARVRVAFGRRQVVGIVIAAVNKSDLPENKLKPIIELIDTTPLLSQQQFELHLWAAHYYQHPVGEALAASLPALIRKGEHPPCEQQTRWRLSTHGKGLPEGALKRAPRQQQLLSLLQQATDIDTTALKLAGISRPVLKEMMSKGLIEAFEIRPTAPELPTPLLAETAPELTPGQTAAINHVSTDKFHTYLLEGETGSGKTEVYLQLIQHVVEAGRQALVLIPEINLTPQTLRRFERRFRCSVVMLHSGLTDNERLRAWNAAQAGHAPIIIGTRSAIFTPLQSPGLIIVDEEHDSSFKQQDGFRYHARDLAVIRGKREDVPVILGSATPSLESLHNCDQKRYTKLVLTGRPGGAKHADWQLVDLRQRQLQTGFSAELIQAIEQTLANNQQVMIFLNRRGFAPTMSCQSCGWIADCHRCSTRLTVHRHINRLLCHHCEYQTTLPHHCPSCQSSKLQFLGQGTQRSESLLEALFPQTPVIRVDRDSTRKKSAMHDVISQVNEGDPCILVGTQMLAKGHHFPNVTLVAILDVDGGLFSPDFRAAEKMGQLIIQVAGRSGRGSNPGKVVLQSHYCDHPLITTLTQQGYPAFARQLLAERKLTELPPYYFLAVIRAEALNPRDADNFLLHARQCAEQIAAPSPSISYLGPLPPTIEKRNQYHRRQLSICAQTRQQLQSLLPALCLQLEQHAGARKVRWSVDVDAQDLN